MTTPPLLVPDDAIESIEKAEEDDDLKTILDIINFISSDMGDPDDDDDDGNDDWVEATEASLDAFYRMIKSGIKITTTTTTDTDTDPNTDTADTGAVVSYYTLLNPIFAILNGWRKEEAIVEVALGCIVAITTKMIDQQETEMEMEECINKVNIIDLIVVKIMQQLYRDESTIQEQACLAIEGLVLSPYYSMNVDLKDQLQYHIDENIIQKELKLARDERITNERNKSYPGRVANALQITL
jgi:hypothetical protein